LFKPSASLERFQQQLDATLEQLETFPESARMNPTFYRQDFRSLLVGDYRLTVLLLENRILVFSIVHAQSGSAFD
jgi:plasmid stabilization system protein ParE